MPRYTYRCKSCVREFEVFHRMSEKLESCKECSGHLFRIPSATFTTTNTAGTKKPGQVVKEFIEEAREEIETEKEKMKLGLDE
jgi:putative FmdB family regulatory protein|tara:strand:+ start:162 stop:410 length:249 start_codon:yes stop_codon:yes gene_type:complete